MDCNTLRGACCVSATMTYDEEYELAVLLGITSGLNADRPTTRKEAAVMALRANNISEKLERLITK